jgi:chromatin remodeling complex protein RSC6
LAIPSRLDAGLPSQAPQKSLAAVGILLEPAPRPLLYRGMPTAKTPTKRKPNAALMKPVQPDEVLAKIVGAKPVPRGELTKKLWDYIKKNKLQDEKKRTMINADEALKVVFGGKKQVSMFEMTKLVSGHIKKE